MSMGEPGRGRHQAEERGGQRGHAVAGKTARYYRVPPRYRPCREGEKEMDGVEYNSINLDINIFHTGNRPYKSTVPDTD